MLINVDSGLPFLHAAPTPSSDDRRPGPARVRVALDPDVQAWARGDSSSAAAALITQLLRYAAELDTTTGVLVSEGHVVLQPHDAFANLMATTMAARGGDRKSARVEAMSLLRSDTSELADVIGGPLAPSSREGRDVDNGAWIASSVPHASDPRGGRRA
jgi:hypothetical protein